MKKIPISLIIALNMVLIVNSCLKEDNGNPGFIKINDQSYTLQYGIIDEAGSVNESDSIFWVRLQSTSSGKPSHFIIFKIYSTSIGDIAEGTYKYDYQPEGGGDFSWIQAGFNLQYDENSNVIEGIKLCDSFLPRGTIVISKMGEKYKFIFDVTFTNPNDDTYIVSGEFTDIMHDSEITYGDIFENC